MKEVFSEYGRTVIAVLVAVGILLLAAEMTLADRKGIAAIAGGILSDQSRETLADNSATNAFEEYRRVSVARIDYDKEHPIYSGELSKASEHFLAETTDGGTLSLQVIGVRDSQGTEVAVTRKGEEYFLYFDEPGVYRIYLRTMSDQVQPKEAVISFPVEDA